MAVNIPGSKEEGASLFMTQPQKSHGVNFFILYWSKHHSTSKIQEGKVILPPNGGLARLHCRKECGTANICAAIFEKYNWAHSLKLHLLIGG